MGLCRSGSGSAEEGAEEAERAGEEEEGPAPKENVEALDATTGSELSAGAARGRNLL
jgi:hypothetical protein